jgi:exopolyphosphatase/guanosine-5'-triphosphate,3'-diphosphate pyrophosphatase
MIYGIIDLGSNTIRLTIYRYEENTLKLLLSKKSIAGLLGYIEDGVMSERGIAKACSVLNNFKDILDNFSIEKSFAFATASLRFITNKNEVLQTIMHQTGFDIDLISGEEEAMLDFFGASKSVDLESGLLIDIGGGSTELVSFDKRTVINAVSIPIGSLNLSLKYVSAVLPKKRNLQDMINDIKDQIRKIEPPIQKQVMACGIGGTLRATRKLYNDINNLPIDNMVIDADKLYQILDTYKAHRKDIIKRVIQLAPDRIHTIITGMVILCAVLKKYSCKQIVVSTYGVREGYFYQRVINGYEV